MINRIICKKIDLFESIKIWTNWSDIIPIKMIMVKSIHILKILECRSKTTKITPNKINMATQVSIKMNEIKAIIQIQNVMPSVSLVGFKFCK